MVPAGGSQHPASSYTVEKRMHFLRQDGKTVFKYAVKGMADVSEAIMVRNGITGDDIKLFIPHQANKRIIEASAKRDGQVHVIAADPGALAKYFNRGAIGAGLHVIETNVLVDIFAHRLHEWPAGRQLSEMRPSNVAEFAIDLTIAAGEQKQQHIARQVLHPVLQRIPNLDVGHSVVL